MTTWRQKILSDFQAPLPALTLVSDPDRLLLDEGIYQELTQRRIEFIDYQDPVAFRLRYEQSYRRAQEHGEVGLVVRSEAEVEEGFPYDLLATGRFLRYRAAAFFPGLSAPVVRQLGTEYLDQLLAAGGEYHAAASNDETCDFILRRIFKVAVETTVSEADLLKLLLSKHYQNQSYPELVESYLIGRLSGLKTLQQMPVADLVRSATHFYQYLQEKWIAYLDKCQMRPSWEDGRGEYGMAGEPFENPDVWCLMDNLFGEGKLQPVAGYSPKYIPQWAYPGIVIDPKEDARKRVAKNCKKLRESLQNAPDWRGWMQLAALWGSVNEQVLTFGLERETQVQAEIGALEKELDAQFQPWMVEKFGSLTNLPYLPQPVMVHHIPHYLASQHQAKTALVVLDGMSWMQWTQIRRYLVQKSNWEFEETAAFAWVPTLTTFSRQAIFSGEIPAYFANSIDTTAKEPGAWKLFWENHGVVAPYTVYQKGLGKNPYAGWETLWKSTTKVTGLVIDLLDLLGHYGIQGHPGVYREIDLWLQNGFLEALLCDLQHQGFTVYLTSDHGNKESRGMGKISQGILAEMRGERVRIYGDFELRDQTAREYHLLSWPGEGLPDNMFALVAPGNLALVDQDELIISHGGISMEETLVPFVRVHWR